MSEASSREFWQRQFPQPIQLASLPFDRPRPPAPSYLRDNIEVELDRSLTNHVLELSACLNVPPLAVTLAAVQVVLFHYGSQDTTIVGTCVRARDISADDALDDMVLLPIQVVWASGEPLSGQDLVLELARGIASASVHAGFPLGELQSLAGAHDPAFGRRLFNVALTQSSFDVVASEAQLPCDPGLLEYLTQCDVVVSFVPSVSGLRLRCDFDTDLFEPDTVKRMLGHVGVVLAGILTSPSVPALSLPLLSESEKIELIDRIKFRGEWRASIATLHELFEAQVKRTPNAVALTCEGHSLTYVELNRRANFVARHLVEQGVKSETLVGLCVDRSNDLVISLLAILKAGGAYLPIDLAYPPDRLGFMLEDAQAPVLLTERRLLGKLPSTRAKVLYIDEILASPVRRDEEANLSSRANENSLAYVIYTSGTTGTPKGSLITHYNVMRLFAATEPWYGFNARDVWTLFHSTAFDFSVWEIWGALLYGGRVVVVPFMVSRSPEAFYALLVSEQVTILNQTPSAFRQLIRAEEVVGMKRLALRQVIFGGEALEIQSLRAWFEKHGDQKPRLVNMYGITETTVHVTYRPLSKCDLDSGSVIGVPIPDMYLFILNRYGNPLPAGVAGEVFVGGEGLARGYLNRPELTAERFLPDDVTKRPGARLYKTGDLARILPSGDIEYLGRIDDQVKIRGFRIELGEIESVLCQHPTVREAVVIVREDESGSKRLTAYVVAQPTTAVVSDLREYLKRKLPDYMLPSAFVILDKFPLTASGKIDRKALPDPEHHRPSKAEDYAAPQSLIEKQLASIWSKVLNLRQVGVDKNFFDLGGDSVLLVQAHARLREELGVNVPIVRLFEHSTIRALGRHLSEVSNSAANTREVQGRRAQRQKDALAQIRAKQRSK